MVRFKIGAFAVGMLPTNCYYTYLENPGAAEQPCVVFDPGDHGAEIARALKDHGLRVEAVFLTHAHFDHIWGAEALLAETGAPLYAWEGEKRLCADAGLNGSADYGRPCTVQPDRFLRDGDILTAAGMTFRLLATPGHTEGSCCYYFDVEQFGRLPAKAVGKNAAKRSGDSMTQAAEKGAAKCSEDVMAQPDGENAARGSGKGTVPVTADGTEDSPRRALLCGDTIFQGSVGRTDMATGSQSALLRSIHDKILTLPDDTILYPGHGALTDLGTERRSNPWFI